MPTMPTGEAVDASTPYGVIVNIQPVRGPNRLRSVTAREGGVVEGP
jgi:hypothetical protein